MEPRLVVGLFHSRGIAEDARNRLKTEGVPGSEIGCRYSNQLPRCIPRRSQSSKPWPLIR